MDAFDNADFSNNSLCPGTNSKHYAFMVLIQDASEKTLAKPAVSSTNVCSKVSSAVQILWQVVDPYGKPLVRLSVAFTCCFQQKIFLLSIVILTQLEKIQPSFNFAFI